MVLLYVFFLRLKREENKRFYYTNTIHSFLIKTLENFCIISFSTENESTDIFLIHFRYWSFEPDVRL